MVQTATRSSPPIQESQDAIRAPARIRALTALVSAGRYGRIQFVNIRGCRVGRFLHHTQDGGRGPRTKFGIHFHERTEAFQGTLLDALALSRCDRLQAAHKSSGTSIVRFAMTRAPVLLCRMANGSQADFPFIIRSPFLQHMPDS